MTITAVLNTLVVGSLAVLVLGWLLFQAVAELRFHLEFRNLDQHLPLELAPLQLLPPPLPPLRPGVIVVDAES